MVAGGLTDFSFQACSWSHHFSFKGRLHIRDWTRSQGYYKADEVAIFGAQVGEAH